MPSENTLWMQRGLVGKVLYLEKFTSSGNFQVPIDINIVNLGIFV